ncbi:hypothetical protein [Cutibacterium avidum]|uniref:hypothetical protein n=1 Tax=Cutibacterium avidum TaxID=33010 RepID=UPI0012DAFC8A|nr:hypothetical protein [Cutibacterium avidum]
MSALAVGVVGLSGCGGQQGETSPSPEVKVTSSAAARSACRDSSMTSRAEKLTTSNVDSLKGHKAWGCAIAGDDDGEVMQFETITQADVDSMKKDPIMADVPVPTGSSCDVPHGAVYLLFLEDGRIFQHRLVECSYHDEK